MHCEKQRKIIIRKQDGSQKEGRRCAHTATCTYKNLVDESTCTSCILRVPILFQIAGCGDRSPQNPVYKQPVFGLKGEIIYDPIEGVEPPSCPEGYIKRDNNPWIFDSQWIECPYQIQLNALTPLGDVQINNYCTLTQQKKSYTDCCECKIDLTSIEETIPTLPSFREQLGNYWQAVKTWVASGRPTRSNEEVEQIHSNYCSRCDWYNKEGQRCKGCGCKVRAEGWAVLNKIKMATEHCPRNFW